MGYFFSEDVNLKSNIDNDFDDKNSFFSKKNIIIGILMAIFLGIGIYLLISKKQVEYYLELLGEEDIVMYQDMNYVDPGYRAYDNKGNSYQQDVVIEGKVNSSIVGEYTIKYSYMGIERERIITVLSKSSQLTFLVLYGEKVMYLETGEQYSEPGYEVIDSLDDNLENKVQVQGAVDVNTPGTYKIVYSVVNSVGVKLVEERTVIVQGRYQLRLKGDNIVKHLLNQKYVDAGCEVLDENGNVVEMEINVSGDVNVGQVGTYILTYSIEYRGYKQEIMRTVEVYNVSYKCSGVVNRYGTTLMVSGSDISNNNKINWYIDGEKYSGGIKKELGYQKVNKAYVIVDDGEQTSCKITNKLLYNFEYDEANTKPFIKCNSYTASDKSNLESILKQAVNEGGYGTRAGVVEAARFLVGGLKYKINYLGPKEVNYNLGRYEKIGLNIASNTGWGCMVSGWVQGMDCTNFVNWAFVQAGLKLKNVYSTTNVHKISVFVDRIKVGDLLLTPGDSSFTHVGIIIGIDDNSIYVAEATTGNINAIVITRLDKNNLPMQGKFSVVRLYEYEQDGNVTNMWVS